MRPRLHHLALALCTAACAQTPVPRPTPAPSASAAAYPFHFAPLQPDLFSTGATLVDAWADIDADGHPDRFVGFNGAPNRLYRNTNSGYIEQASNLALADPRPTRAAAWGDFDSDGDPDLLIGFASSPGASVIALRRNDGTRFTDVTRETGLARDSGVVRQLAWVDYDADGDLDLLVAFRDRPNAFFRNDAGHFIDVAPQLGLADPRHTVGALWVDVDDDGGLDLVVANMDGDANAIYRNDGGHFTDVAESSGVAWGGRAPHDPENGTVRPCAADVDGDGRIDLFFANYGPNGLFLNRGGGRFDDASAAWGVAIDGRYDTCIFGDADNDGRLDLYVNGTITGGKSFRDYLMRNTGARLEDATPPEVLAFQADHGATWVDVDGDGALDLALAGAQATGMHALLHNLLPAPDASRSLRVRVLDPRGRATRAGAEVRVFAAGTRRVLATRLVDSGSGYDAQSDLPVHVGLADWSRVDVEVTWPAAGRRVVVRMRDVDPRAWRGKVIDVRL
jgi:hypothetical protein